MTKKSLLQWQIDMGADEAIAEMPRSYVTEAPSILQPQPTSIPVEVAVMKPLSAIQASPALATNSARELANQAYDLATLEQYVRVFDGCSLKKTATNTVFADGNPQAKLMVIGEAPGAQEDMQGIPFCGPSGKLLDGMFAAIGMTREHVYITNTVYWRPPGNRQPSKEETTICLPFVERHIALVAPKLLVLAGGTAVSSLLGRDDSISRMRGKTLIYQNPYLQNPIPVIVTYHPSYLLRQPSQKRLAWQDLIMIQSVMQGA